MLVYIYYSPFSLDCRKLCTVANLIPGKKKKKKFGSGHSVAQSRAIE